MSRTPTEPAKWEDDYEEALVDYTSAALSGLLANPARKMVASKMSEVVEEAGDLAEAVLEQMGALEEKLPEEDLGVLDCLLQACLTGVCASPEHWGADVGDIVKEAVQAARLALADLGKRIEEGDDEDEEEEAPVARRRPRRT